MLGQSSDWRHSLARQTRSKRGVWLAFKLLVTGKAKHTPLLIGTTSAVYFMMFTSMFIGVLNHAASHS